MNTNPGNNPLEELDARHDELLMQLEALDSKIVSVLDQFTRPSQKAQESNAATVQ